MYFSDKLYITQKTAFYQQNSETRHYTKPLFCNKHQQQSPFHKNAPSDSYPRQFPSSDGHQSSPSPKPCEWHHENLAHRDSLCYHHIQYSDIQLKTKVHISEKKTNSCTKKLAPLLIYYRADKKNGRHMNTSAISVLSK